MSLCMTYTDKTTRRTHKRVKTIYITLLLEKSKIMTTSLCRVECRTLTCNLLTLCPHVRSRVYITVERPSVCLSARQSDRSTTAAACGGFAAGRSASRKYRNTTGAGAQQQRRRSTALTAANADSVASTAEGRG